MKDNKSGWQFPKALEMFTAARRAFRRLIARFADAEETEGGEDED